MGNLCQVQICLRMCCSREVCLLQAQRSMPTSDGFQGVQTSHLPQPVLVREHAHSLFRVVQGFDSARVNRARFAWPPSQRRSSATMVCAWILFKTSSGGPFHCAARISSPKWLRAPSSSGDAVRLRWWFVAWGHRVLAPVCSIVFGLGNPVGRNSSIVFKFRGIVLGTFWIDSKSVLKVCLTYH